MWILAKNKLLPINKLGITKKRSKVMGLVASAFLALLLVGFGVVSGMGALGGASVSASNSQNEANPSVTGEEVNGATLTEAKLLGIWSGSNALGIDTTLIVHQLSPSQVWYWVGWKHVG